jgi:hypothetical protein
MDRQELSFETESMEPTPKNGLHVTSSGISIQSNVQTYFEKELVLLPVSRHEVVSDLETSRVCLTSLKHFQTRS